MRSLTTQNQILIEAIFAMGGRPMVGQTCRSHSAVVRPWQTWVGKPKMPQFSTSWKVDVTNNETISLQIYAMMNDAFFGVIEYSDSKCIRCFPYSFLLLSKSSNPPSSRSQDYRRDLRCPYQSFVRAATWLKFASSVHGQSLGWRWKHMVFEG